MSDIQDNGSTLDAEQRERITNKLGLLARTVLVLFTLDSSLVTRHFASRPIAPPARHAVSEAIISLRAMDARGFPIAPLHDPWAPIASAGVCSRELRQLREAQSDSRKAPAQDDGPGEGPHGHDRCLAPALQEAGEVTLRRPGGPTLEDPTMPRYPLRIESDDQGRMTLSSWRARPLGREQLLKNSFHQTATLRIEFDGVVATSDAGESFDFSDGLATYSFSTSLALGPVALLPGGWLPSIVAGGHHLLVLDRHLVSDLVAAEKSMQGAAPASLLALLTDVPVQLNVLAHALEGRHRARPGIQAIREDVLETYGKLRRLLPKAELVPQDVAIAVSGAEGLWHDMAGPHTGYMAFLTDAWPHLHPVAPNERLASMTYLRALAQKHGVAVWSLPFLAVIVAVCTPQGNAGMRVLKPDGKSPASSKVYNALADLLHLQLVVAGNAQFPDRPSALLTRDRGLAELWVGLGIHSITMKGTAHTATVPMGQPGLLLADLSDEIICLFGGAALTGG